MMAHMFELFIGKTIEVYIDDMLVKSLSPTDHFLQLREVFKLMRQHQLRHNLDKCTFGMKLVKFFECLVSK